MLIVFRLGFDRKLANNVHRIALTFRTKAALEKLQNDVCDVLQSNFMCTFSVIFIQEQFIQHPELLSKINCTDCVIGKDSPKTKKHNS